MANPWDNDAVLTPFDAALAHEGVSGKLADVARSIYQQESSGGKNTKTSNAGAVGGMQIVPATFASVADKGWNIADPVQNARAGIRYLKQLDKQSGGDAALTAAGYYGGPGGLEKARNGIAVSDPRNPNAPNTLQYGQQVAARIPKNPVVGALNAVTDAVVPSAQAAHGNPWDMDEVIQPTERQKLLTSLPMRLAKGGKDPIDGAAQFLQRILPDGVVNAVNKAADFVGGEGTFAGDVLGIKGMTPNQMTADIRGSNAEYEAARSAAGQSGFDGARFTGNVLSPVNAAVGRVVPMGRAGDSLKMLSGKGAIAGAAGAATQPVMSDNFAGEKAGQIGIGAVTGGVITPAISKAAESVARLVRSTMQNGTISKTPEGIAYEIKASLARDDIDAGQIPKQVMDKLTAEVQHAMQSGQEINAPALLRKLDFERVGVQPTLGQLTRDPTQYTKELNLRGIQGVGEPIANRLNEQQGQIASRFRQRTAGAQNPYEAGRGLIETLQAKDKEMTGGVRAAYQAFKDSTGKELPVPTEALKQGYKAVLSDFDDHIPSAVRKKFEEIVSGPKAPHSHGAKAPEQNPMQILGPSGEVLSDLTPKPVGKTLSIEDAEKLIKTINNNYNPANKPQALALGKLRKAVQDSIIGATGSGEGMEAATLANFARDKARERFSAIDSTPALKAAINAAEPDDFVKKYVINGKVREINALADIAGPEGQQVMRQQMLKYLEGKAFGANMAGDGSASQARFNQELNSIGKNKLTALLGQETTDDLFAVGRVMAYIQQRPAGSAVNESNTGAAVANLLSKIGGTVKGAPYINDFIVKPIGAFKDRAATSNALAAELPKQAAQLDPETVNRLARLMRPVPVTAGAAIGYSVR